MWKKDDFLLPSAIFWELFVIESIPKCSTSFLIHREILSGLCYWLIIVYWKNNAILIVQWTMLFMSILPWKCNNKLLQKWILCQDNQIKSNHNHIYKHFIFWLSYLSVIIKYTNITSKYHFIENFHQNNIVFNCELKIHSSKSSFWNHIHESTSINLMI